MNALIISDKDFQTGRFWELKASAVDLLKNKGFQVESIDVGKEDVAFCMGCFGCWIKKPGECVIDDLMLQINRKWVNSNVVIYLCPIVFGQFSANIKNAVDRWIPTQLPFFIKRSDGLTMHPRRYQNEKLQIFIGYGEGVSEDDRQLFYDIIKNHRKGVEVLNDQNNGEIFETLSQIISRMAGAKE